ncbi:unnamed protein product [Gongylonema pulchrum]|uniref:Conserved oligomeric Golgi complex subunit 4 n=1 Tax=Gongylonema pulchrum TaxID=637853 RepID=A0A183ELH5_9BILA|nr:unnamed protein product [Gongylonema pulchrum]
MHTRTELYWRYLKRRLNDANAKTFEQQKESESENMTEEDVHRLESTREKQKRERDGKLNDLVLRSTLGTRMQELLGRYVLMEQYYMKESVAKAMTMDLKETDSLTSSMLDDVFFIVRKCVRRSLSSSSVDCVCAVLNNGVTLLETDFLKYIYAGIKAGYPGAGWTAEAYQTAQTAYNVIQHGKTVADAGPEKQKELSEVEKGKLENAVSQLDDLVRKFDSSANVGVDKLCAAAFRPKLKSSMELYLNVSHTPSDSEFADFEADDPFMENFIATLDRHLASFEPLLISVNYTVNFLFKKCLGMEVKVILYENRENVI